MNELLARVCTKKALMIREAKTVYRGGRQGRRDRAQSAVRPVASPDQQDSIQPGTLLAAR
jgi:hypothetical protein